MIDELLEHVSLKTILVGLAASLVLISVSKRIVEERKIRALGGHTRKVTNWLPFGKCHTVFNSISHALSVCMSLTTRTDLFRH